MIVSDNDDSKVIRVYFEKKMVRKTFQVASPVAAGIKMMSLRKLASLENRVGQFLPELVAQLR